MQAFTLRLDGWVRRHRRLVLVAWALAFAAALPLAAQQADRLTGGGFAVPGSQSDKAAAALLRDFDVAEESRLAAVVVVDEGATAAQYAAAIERLRAGAARIDHVVLTPAALAAARAGEPRTIVVPLRVDVSDFEAIDVATTLRTELGIGAARDGAVTTHLVGQGALWAGLQDISKKDLQTAESVGFPIVALILLAVFGSLAAAALPLAVGAVSVIVTGALIYLLSGSMEMSTYTTNMASMLGIGLAVDYSLFVLARYREEVAAGRDLEQARAVALQTSGVAVIFSGLTVIASLAGLLLIDTTILRSMALGSILVVAVSVLTASTLLPALISLLGRRAHEPGRYIARARSAAAARLPRRRRRQGAPFWDSWTARVMRRPWLAIGVSAGILLLLTLPVLTTKTADGALHQFPARHEIPTGFAAAAAVTGPGASTPVAIVATPREGAADELRNVASLQALARRIAGDAQVARVDGPIYGRDGRTALLQAIARTEGEGVEAKALVDRLRAELPAAAPALDLQVGGATAALLDFNDKVSGSMWFIVLFVCALSYAVLLVLLRSAVLPLKAVLMNLLSVGAAYGVVVAVFQWGWVDGLFGFESAGWVDTVTAPLMLAVVFGLSMDYEVFLLTRIRERYLASGDTTRAVAEGLASSARTITSAALIMVCVFAVFIGTGVPSIQQIGLGLAVAIALDATLVRLVLVPAAMAVMGRWNWWLPRPLARVLPAQPAPVSA